MAVLTDPIADMLTRIRNAGRAKKHVVELPASNTKVRIAELLKSEGYVNQVEVVNGLKSQRTIKITLRYRAARQPMIQEITRISKPGCRIYATAEELANLRNPVLTMVVSTSKGLMTGRQAKEANVGGEIMFRIQ